MLSFQEFIAKMPENSRRTALGLYPPLYGAGQYCPLDNMTHGANALFGILKIHGINDKGNGRCSMGTKTLRKKKKKKAAHKKKD